MSKTCMVFLRPLPGTRGRVGETCDKPAPYVVTTQLQGTISMCRRHYLMTKPTKKPNPHAAALGRLGGSKNTPAQNAARAKNGRKGGAPTLAERAAKKLKEGAP